MKTEKIKIRRVKKRDKKTVNDLLQVFTNFTQVNVIDEGVLYLLSKERDNYAAVATIEENGKEKVIGFAMIHFGIHANINGFVGKIEDMVVSPIYRGQGVGTKLCKHLIDIARVFQVKNIGVKKIELTSNPKRIAAQRLYKKLGFEKRETDVFELKL